jgi:MarR family 2-MHQ and catechol resistance regulon transcriptional repressor
MATKFIGNEEEVDSLNTFICLMRAADSISQRISTSYLKNNLTISQFGILEALYHLGPMCQKELSSKILKSTANITTVIDNLEKRKLVSRVRNITDKRFITVELTQSGKSIIEKIFPEHAKVISSEFSILNSKEKKELQTLCKIIGRKKR